MGYRREGPCEKKILEELGLPLTTNKIRLILRIIHVQMAVYIRIMSLSLWGWEP